ncbi:MAG: ABC transporter permease [Actinomycetia bacterium]|nr:ABC transporter permease [Actinomycetes bacterium]
MRGWLLPLLARRIAVMIPVLVVVSIGAFLLLHMVPGGPAQALLAGRPATPDVINAINAKHGLDKPLVAQYLDWLWHAVRFDFGRSIKTGQPVTQAIGQAAGVSVQLGLCAFALTIVLGLSLGIAGALRRNSALDQTIVGVSVVGISAPAFVTGIVLMYAFSVALNWFPTSGPGGGGTDRLYHLTLPAIALSFSALALIVKVTRAALIEELDKDYIAFARARGFSMGYAVRRHALRNALVPVVTAAGLVFVQVITGALLVEVTFTIPGVGSKLVDSVHAVDIPMLQGLVVFIAIFIVLLHLLIDVIYATVDPRVRLGKVEV